MIRGPQSRRRGMPGDDNCALPTPDQVRLKVYGKNSLNNAREHRRFGVSKDLGRLAKAV
jgi:hypothetical protein